LYLLLAAGVLFGYFWLFENKKKLRINNLAALLLALLHTVLGVICVKLFALIENGSFSGMSLYGGIFIMPLFYWLGAKLTKRSVADVFDVFTVCMVSTLFFARINCLFSGCCLGNFCFGSDTLRWPTREIELIFYLAVVVWFGIKNSKPHTAGIVYPIYMMAYGVFRFIVEWFRESDFSFLGMHRAHFWSVLSFIIGLCVYLKLIHQTKRRTKKKTGVVEK